MSSAGAAAYRLESEEKRWRERALYRHTTPSLSRRRHERGRRGNEGACSCGDAPYIRTGRGSCRLPSCQRLTRGKAVSISVQPSNQLSSLTVFFFLLCVLARRVLSSSLFLLFVGSRHPTIFFFHDFPLYRSERSKRKESKAFPLRAFNFLAILSWRKSSLMHCMQRE